MHKSDIIDIHENIIIESRNASFFEDQFRCKVTHEVSSLKSTYESISNIQDLESVLKENIEKPRRSKRERILKYFGPNFLTFLLENEPPSFKEAMSTHEGPLWKEAIESEIDSIRPNNIRKLVDLPS